MSQGGALLRAEGIGIAFGGVRALEGVGFAAHPGEILAIIGPNGAGKTTLFNIVSGLYAAPEGRVLLGGQDVTGLPPHRLARLGLSRTFQNLQLFLGMSAVENVMAGRHMREGGSLLSDLLRLPATLRRNRETREAAMALLGRVGLADRAERPAGALPYGALKRLEIARALATGPRVLLLDEPAAGCSPAESAELDALIAGIAAEGVAVVLIEHDMRLVMRLSRRVLVLEGGRMLAEGPPAQVRQDPRVVEAYLGRHGGGGGGAREEAARA